MTGLDRTDPSIPTSAAQPTKPDSHPVTASPTANDTSDTSLQPPMDSSAKLPGAQHRLQQGQDVSTHTSGDKPQHSVLRLEQDNMREDESAAAGADESRIHSGGLGNAVFKEAKRQVQKVATDGQVCWQLVLVPNTPPPETPVLDKAVRTNTAAARRVKICPCMWPGCRTRLPTYIANAATFMNR